MELNGDESKPFGLLENKSTEVENRVWKGIKQSLSVIENVPDEDVVISSERTNDSEFEDATDFLALAWRLSANGQKEMGFDFDLFKKILVEKPKLRFYLAYKALGETHETEKELTEQGMIFDKVEKEWTNELSNVLADEVNKLDDMNESEVEGRLFVYADLATRSLHNLDLIDIDKISKESAEYSNRPIGESYLTLEQIEKVIVALLDMLGEKNIPFSANAENYRLTIVRYMEKLIESREKNAGLANSLFTKKTDQ